MVSRKKNKSKNKHNKSYPTVRGGISDSIELQNLLYAISEAFPLVITVNLTKNTYTILEYENFTTKKAGAGGVFDELVSVGASTIDPAHKQKFIDTFSRDKLLKAFERGEKKVELECRQMRDSGEYGWVKTTVIFFKNNENSDVMEITFAAPIEEQKTKELENTRLRKLMESVILANYEYISVINVKSGVYELYASDVSNAHQVPLNGDFNRKMLMIRDTLIPEDERKDYYENLNLSALVRNIDGMGCHSYRYRLCDTPEMRWREATFHYCAPDREDILMTVRDIHDEVMAQQAKRTEEMFRRNKERQAILSGLGFDVIVDHDVLTGEVEVLGEVETILKRDMICENFPQGEIDAGMIHPDDVRLLIKTEDLKNVDNTFSIDYRIKRGDGTYFWCRCKGVVLKDENGKPYRCLHKLIDIDSQKRSEQKLLYEAQRDSLTGLFNNMTTLSLIENYLSGEGADSKHALLVVDIDNLKEVNDSFGHKAGDKLLQYMAEIMRSSFRSSDILGRVGGDEFVIFLKNIESAPTVMECVDAMRKRVVPVKVDEKDAECLPVFSTGISLYPQHGKTYNEIFRRADAAMYYIKSHGKDGVKLYDETIDSAK